MHSAAADGTTKRQNPTTTSTLSLQPATLNHPGGNPGTNLNSMSHRYQVRQVAFDWELTKETMYLPQVCLQGGT